MGWSAGTTAKMAKRYGHIGTDVQRVALESLATPPADALSSSSTNVDEGDTEQPAS